MKGLLRELKRRKVVRVTLAYAAGAFVAVQAAQLYFPALGLPDWAFRAVAVLSLLGLPVAMVLAWVFDITPDGVRRTSAEPITLPLSPPPTRPDSRWSAGHG
jgi:adenylate cyclase